MIRYGVWIDLDLADSTDNYYTVDLPDTLSPEEVERELREYIFAESGISWGYEIYEEGHK